MDQSTGTIWLLLTWNDGKTPESRIQPGFGRDSRRVYVSHSSDDGQTFSQPEEITQAVKDEHWGWYATGPGAGIQIQHGPHRGRLVIPCDHKQITDRGKLTFSHAIYSDDHGKSWQLGGTAPEAGVNECEVVELAEGRLLLNMRNYDRDVRARQVVFSDDGGQSWHDQRHDRALIAPTCQASVRRISWPADDRPGVILFSNPASTKSRVQLTIRASYDDAQTWADSRELYSGSSAYSCLCVLPDGQVACVYERDNYQKIVLARFGLDWVKQKP